MVGNLSSIVQGVLLAALMSVFAAAGPNGVVDATEQVQGQPSAARVTGMVEQSTRLPAPQDGMLEVFVRQDDGALIVAIVPQSLAGAVEDGQRIDFAVHSDGTQTYRARDGASRTVPRVRAVGVPVRVGGQLDDLSLMLGLLVLLMAGFGVVALVVARARAAPGLRLEPNEDAFEVEAAEAPLLPDDPAQAMAEMARRSQAEQ